jgi:NDP-sugar pyrophosphorylase family protein
MPTVLAKPADGRADVLDLMRALGLREMPIVDIDGRLRGIHLETDILGLPLCKSWAVVMAGGRGTRLAPLTSDTPKPMLPVAGRPILERLVLHLVGSGIKKIFLSVNYLAEKIEKHFGDGRRYGCTIEYLREDTDCPLGTGGALGLLSDMGYAPKMPLLVMNGDLITSFSAQDLLRTHRSLGAAATVAVSKYEHQVPFGVLEASDGRLSRIVEKPTHSWLVNAGIYAIEPELLTRIPRGELFPITRLFEDCLRRQEQVGLWQLTDHWQDIGRPAELAQAQGRI